MRLALDDASALSTGADVCAVRAVWGLPFQLSWGRRQRRGPAACAGDTCALFGAARA